MNRTPADSAWVLPSWLRSWERFWFTPDDPTKLCLIRLLTGLLVLYTHFAYSYSLQEFMGENAWVDLQLRLLIARDRPANPQPLSNPKVHDFPMPSDPADAKLVTDFRSAFGVDPRQHGAPLPKTMAQREYLLHYAERYKTPPPGYPLSEQDEERINRYIRIFNEDPRKVYAHGAPIWSLFFHVTDPHDMALVHAGIVFVTFLFAIGFATRVTSVLTWFGALCYIHRNTQVLFGADAMIVILLTYIMVGPSGATLSVDRLIARWWSRARPDVLRRWARLLGRPEPAELAPVRLGPPEPSVMANFSMRLLQIHLCIIYAIAGLAKLLGASWWSGTAVWGTLANSEFAPLNTKLYYDFMVWVSDSPLLLNLLVNGGTLFTLAFEIGYCFLIWRPSLRWVVLSAAITLHGLIGMVMGLKTFALVMLIMNMAFLNREEIAWLLRGLRRSNPASIPMPAPTPAPPRTPVTAVAAVAKK